MNVNQEVYQLY